MIFRTIQGVRFRVRSPSLYELADLNTESWVDICAVSFNQGWHIDVLMKQGHSIHRGPFKSLSAAAACIAGQTRGVA